VRASHSPAWRVARFTVDREDYFFTRASIERVRRTDAGRVATRRAATPRRALGARAMTDVEATAIMMRATVTLARGRGCA